MSTINQVDTVERAAVTVSTSQENFDLSNSNPDFNITDSDAERLRKSFLLLIPASEEASIAFYENLFARMPSTRSMFSQDIRVQGEKFMMMLAVMLDAVDNPTRLEAECKSLATSHARYGVTTEMFTAVGQALLETMEKSLGKDFDQNVKASWEKLYGVASRTMMASGH